MPWRAALGAALDMPLFLQAVDGALLLVEVAGVFDFGFYGFEFVSYFRRESHR